MGSLSAILNSYSHPKEQRTDPNNGRGGVLQSPSLNCGFSKYHVINVCSKHDYYGVCGGSLGRIENQGYV